MLAYWTYTGIKIFSLKTDFRLFSNSQDHSWDQCKSEGKIFMVVRGLGVWKGLREWVEPLNLRKCLSFRGLCLRSPIFYNISKTKTQNSCLTKNLTASRGLWPLAPHLASPQTPGPCCARASHARYQSREHPRTFQSFFKICILIPDIASSCQCGNPAFCSKLLRLRRPGTQVKASVSWRQKNSR